MNTFLFEFRLALGLDEDRPSRSEAPQRIVQPSDDGDEFGRHRAIEIGTAEPGGALEAAILVKDDTFVDQRRPGQEIRETRRWAAIFGEVHHRAMSIERASDAEMAGDAQVAAHHIDEHRIALRRPNRGGVSDHRRQEPGDPQTKAEAQSRGQRPVQDRNGARRPAEQDRLGGAPGERERRRLERIRRRPASPSDERSAAEGEERQEEARRGERDRHTVPRQSRW